MRRGALRLGLGVVVALACGCSSADYYRLPRPGGAEGSIANEIEYAFFSMVRPAYGSPHAYTEFNPDIDDQVVFFAGTRPIRHSFTLRGTLSRPDGAEHASFTRAPHPAHKGPTWSVQAVESFPMTALRPYPGRWTLRLFLDDTLVGIYEFVLADKSRIQEFRRPR